MKTKLIEYFLYDLSSDDFDLINQEYEDQSENKFYVIRNIKGTDIKVKFPKAYNSGRVINLPELVDLYTENPEDLAKILSNRGEERLKRLLNIDIENKEEQIHDMLNHLDRLKVMR